MDNYNGLYVALQDPSNSSLNFYLGNTATHIIREDLGRLIGTSDGQTRLDLKAFTMAAMQGLCTGKDANDLSVSDVEGIAWGAGEIAQRTLHRLSELSKQQ